MSVGQPEPNQITCPPTGLTGSAQETVIISSNSRVQRNKMNAVTDELLALLAPISAGIVFLNEAVCLCLAQLLFIRATLFPTAITHFLFLASPAAL